MAERVLGGGAVNQVVRIGTTVRRTPSERSGYVRELLALFESRGWEGAPRHIGTDEQGREVFGYVEGRAAVTPHERAAACTDAGLVRVAQLVRAVHDMTHGTPLAGDRDVVCHNDLAPKNTVYTVEGADWWPTALLDWDLAAPGDRVHDLAHVCWQYLDLGPGITDVGEAARRIALICDAYGPYGDGEGVVDVILWWQDRCREGIEAGAERGEPAMVRLMECGAVDEVRDAYAWTAQHRRELGMFLH
ncbi:phosphotransferase family protein [Streptomyces lanatus]|uniref:Phosphotransferase n=1 Tax=Streptomyces lanatus TaxID=66900 RepID=A0ABV1Y2X5_9ACTN|nr:phosphotransferase [Streptomyces lanatus]GHH14331.1 trifolitoxin immunity domain-containing protein [Streptomyces lanatus]